jgi:ferredoxin-nitrate reductase
MIGTRYRHMTEAMQARVIAERLAVALALRRWRLGFERRQCWYSRRWLDRSALDRPLPKEAAVQARPAGSGASNRIAEPWGQRAPYGPGAAWPVRTDTFLEDGVEPERVEAWVPSACVLCSNGCGLDIAVAGGRMVGVRGRADDRVNHGRLGPKGLFGWQANNAADRLTRPLVREGGELVETDWDTAMGRIVQRSRRQLDTLGPGSIGFYTSGQLFLEEYYTLAVIGKAGLGTPHMDGNTRLCTATAAQALKETFGTDGQPASYTDVDHADTILHWGHNVAETQTVLWMRILDRRRGSDPPRLVVVDPRPTPAAREADLHLAVRPGSNLALLNGLLHELIEHDWIDQAFIDANTVGFDQLCQTVQSYDPERVASICGVPADQIREAARILGTAERLLSTVLQGVYQSTGATAAACQVNNLNLVRGMIGRPGCGVLQMNGQPTAQNTRETGADGDLPGFRNWDNEAHIRELAELWNVDPIVIPHWAPPTHAMQIWRYAEQGSIGLLWISATNPAVSLPELHRIRSILASEELFVVVQDAFLTETAGYADVVLPTAIWGEKTGTFTNADRTVHLSERAVDPPGEARSDLDIFLDYARRMEFRDRDGQPLVRWHDPESAFEAWKACSRGRPCDYSGMSYERLREAGAIQWPCNNEHPDGTERLYTDLRFNTDPDVCENYGHDLLTGAVTTETEYRAGNPAGRAILKAADYQPPHELPSEDYPLLFSTGRTVYHFHTRTKTARARQLQQAAPDPWVELSAADAERKGIIDGDLVRVESAHGRIQARARITGITQGTIFAPFHYGYFDTTGAAPNGRPRAANELTITEWDPVSKQPNYKVCAVRVTKVADPDRQEEA